MRVWSNLTKKPVYFFIQLIFGNFHEAGGFLVMGETVRMADDGISARAITSL